MGRLAWKLVAWSLGASVGLAWRRRRGWLWVACLWAGYRVLRTEEAPLLALALLAAGLGLTWWALSGLSGLLGGRGAMHPDNGLRTTRAERQAEELRRQRERGRGVRLERVSMGPEPPPRRWPVRALVPQGPRPRWRLRWHPIPFERVVRGYVTTVIGSGGTGKSYLLVDLAIALLTGMAWLGQQVMQLRSVLYVDAELDLDTMRERSYQVARGRGLEAPPGPRQWWQLPLAWVRPWGLHYLSLPVSLATEEGLALVAAKVRACRAELILFDSLTIGSAGAGLADQNAWNRILAGMESWGVPTICIDHMGKSEGRGAVGSFMKQAKVRSALELERKPDGTIAVEHAKSNFGPMLPAWTIKPVFAHCDPAADPAAGLVRFDVCGAGGAKAERPMAPAAPAMPARRPRWSARVQQVLDAWHAHGGAGATIGVIAEELKPVLGDRAYKTVHEAVTKQLEPAGALLLVDKVPTKGGGPAAGRYVALGSGAQGISAESPADAVGQAEALLQAQRRRLLPPSMGGAGGMP